MIETAGIADIKKELQELSPKAIKEICLRLAKYKKENKELISYLLFEAQDEDRFVQNVKEEISTEFEAINKANLHWAKKSIRKILRLATRYIRYSGNKQTEVELLIHFCMQLNASGIRYRESTALLNLYNAQLKKINKALAGLHEDLQYDYAELVTSLAH